MLRPAAAVDTPLPILPTLAGSTPTTKTYPTHRCPGNPRDRGVALCHIETRTQGWFLVFNGGRPRQADVQVALKGSQCQFSRASMGITGLGRPQPGRQAGRHQEAVSHQLELCCPLVAPSAAANCPVLKRIFICRGLPQFPYG